MRNFNFINKNNIKYYNLQLKKYNQEVNLIKYLKLNYQKFIIDYYFYLLVKKQIKILNYILKVPIKFINLINNLLNHLFDYLYSLKVYLLNPHKIFSIIYYKKLFEITLSCMS